MAALHQPLKAQQEISLWGEATPPYSKESTLQEYIAPCWGADCAYQVVSPTLTIYTPPGRGNGNAVLVLPGGGYDVVAIFHEGSEIAEALASNGTTAAVLSSDQAPYPQCSNGRTNGMPGSI